MRFKCHFSPNRCHFFFSLVYLLTPCRVTANGNAFHPPRLIPACQCVSRSLGISWPLTEARTFQWRSHVLQSVHSMFIPYGGDQSHWGKAYEQRVLTFLLVNHRDVGISDGTVWNLSLVPILSGISLLLAVLCVPTIWPFCIFSTVRRPVHRFIKPFWWWSLFGSGNGGLFFSVCRGGAGIRRRSLVSVGAENHSDRSVFFYLLRCYLQSFQNNQFLLVYLSVSSYICLCNLVFY